MYWVVESNTYGNPIVSSVGADLEIKAPGAKPLCCGAGEALRCHFTAGIPVRPGSLCERDVSPRQVMFIYVKKGVNCNEKSKTI